MQSARMLYFLHKSNIADLFINDALLELYLFKNANDYTFPFF